ncbi:NAD-dependent epimerase/dehydratase family protein [Cupriavidus necator]|uniref:NAD-dependent epimerase/dehydratase family protein n=1 Tax=Cupriavidus necator TaxID=106590 RepID=UPI003ECE2C43
MTIRWITPLLGTAPAMAMQGAADDIHLVDVRDLVDKSGNRADSVAEKIQIGHDLLKSGKKTVVCCDYGISRSNAIAAGILARAENISLEAAVRRVQDATGEQEIKAEPLRAVRQALGGSATAAQRGVKRRVLLTGGSGFLGRYVLTELADKVELLVPSRGQLDLSRGATQLDVMVGEGAADVLVHLANPRVYTSNVAMGEALTMLRNVIDVCISRDIPLIYISSWEIYSGYPGDLRADESLPALPRGPYAETKYLSETLIEHCKTHYGLRCALVRSSPVYGLGSDRPKFIYSFIDKARRGEKIVTHAYRNGDPALDLLHASDLASLIAKVVCSQFVGTLNVGSGAVHSTPSIAQRIVEMLDSKSAVERTLIDADTARITMDFGRAKSLLNWEPSIRFEDGLAGLQGLCENRS